MNDHSVVVRRARVEESEAAAEVISASRAVSVLAIPPEVHSKAEVREWFDRVVMRQMDVWVAESRLQRILVAVMALQGDWVKQLYVLPGWTGKGIGRQLIALAKRRSPSGLELWTFKSNLGAGRFYEREGFIAVEETDGAGNEEGAPDVRFRWQP